MELWNQITQTLIYIVCTEVHKKLRLISEIKIHMIFVGVNPRNVIWKAEEWPIKSRLRGLKKSACLYIFLLPDLGPQKVPSHRGIWLESRFCEMNEVFFLTPHFKICLFIHFSHSRFLIILLEFAWPKRYRFLNTFMITFKIH